MQGRQMRRRWGKEPNHWGPPAGSEGGKLGVPGGRRTAGNGEPVLGVEQSGYA